jgi:glycosyltransferase involved in cell wall biosynthesis/uncharacterized membrane protein YbhN (UPF0104 family)
VSEPSTTRSAASRSSGSKVRFYLPILVSVLLLGAAFNQFGSVDILSGLTEIPMAYLALMGLASVANLLVVSGRLARLLRHLGYAIPLGRVLFANITGLASSLLVVSLVGSMVGRHLVLRGHGVEASANAFTVAYERAILATVGGVFFCIGGVVLFGQDAVWSIADQLPIPYIAGALVAAGTVALTLSRNKIEGALRAVVFSLKSAGRVLEISGITVVAQSLSFLVYVAAAAALSPDTPIGDLLAAAAVIAFASSFPLSVNGWGVREVASVFVFGSLGISAVDALTISISVGLVSTVTVLGAGFIATTVDARSKRARAVTTPPGVRDPSAPDRTAANTASFRALKAMGLVLPLAAGILLFFQAGVTWNGGLISVNLADPVAIIGLALVVLTVISERRPVVQFSATTWFWLFACTTVLAISFVIGWTRFGVTPWALNNRIVGWVVLMGYVALGGFLIRTWARYGFRRLGEALMATAASVTVVGLVMLFVHHFLEIDTLGKGNFQGFSFNRNSFAFQLNTALCFALVLAPARWRDVSWNSPRALIWSVLTALILYGIWQAQSRTGMAVALGLICLALIFRMTPFRAVVLAVVPAGGLYLAITALTLALSSMVPNADEIARLARAPEHFNPESVTERWRSMLDSLTIWLDHPVFGAGLGAYMHSHLAGGNTPLVIHSVPGWLLAEFGLTGVAALLAAPLVGLAGLARELFRRDRRVDPTTALLTLLVANFAIFGLTHDIAYQRIFWLSLGAVMASRFLYLTRDDGPPRARPLRVLHVITSLDRGGAETMLKNLTRIARDGGREHAVATLVSDSAMARDVRRSGTPLVELGFSRNFPNPIGLFRLAAMIRRFRPDIVQGWMYHGDLTALIAVYLSGRRRKTKLVWGVRCSDMDFSRYSLTLRVVVGACKALSRLPDMVIANSMTGKRFHEALGYRPKRFDVVANGIDTRRFRPRPELRRALREEFGIPSDARVAICVARVDPMKDHEGLACAAAKVPDLWLVLVGKGTEDLPGGDRLVRYGVSDDIPSILNIADAVVLGSRFGEGFSNALAEGMASGLYPITTDVGDGRVVVEGVGAVVPPEDTEAMIRALSDFTAMPDADLAAAKSDARNRIEARYTLPTTLRAFEARYTALYDPADPETDGDR